ncbi:DDE superfamily endonuclease [Popillia japonica]|uniref:DDE superfamily endonuclease n=1 Tax=Popillia japonica TaxID=7064 RepID=A0AAW1KKQ9_POPJA
MPLVVSACCILHNIIERNKGPFKSVWLYNAQEGDKIYPQPRNISKQVATGEATSIRNHLKNYMAKTYPLRSSRGKNLPPKKLTS